MGELWVLLLAGVVTAWVLRKTPVPCRKHCVVCGKEAPRLVCSGCRAEVDSQW